MLDYLISQPVYFSLIYSKNFQPDLFIMSALIYDIKRFAIHDGPGIRTTIFFKGCPLGCWWCHNPESLKAEPEITTRKNKLDGECYNIQVTTGKKTSLKELMQEIKKEWVFMNESNGGVTLSGGEPLLQHKFLLKILKKLRKEKIHTAVDTTGYASQEVFNRIAMETDLFLYDLKLMDDAMHQKYTSVSNKLILRNLEFLHENRIQTIIRFPLIPGINDNGNMEEMRDFLISKCPDFKEIHILPYHKIASHKYRQFGIVNKMKDQPEPTEKDLEKAKLSFEKAGFKVLIGG